MDRHTIPRQITTFEFKLIGFMSIKQFIYLAMFGGLAVFMFLFISVPFINIILAIMTALTGAMFAFFRHNDRPLDVWLKNLFKRLTAPSQYYYIKVNAVPNFLRDIYVVSDPTTTQFHLDATRKLAAYTASKGQTQQTDSRKHEINQLIHETKISPKGSKSKKTEEKQQASSVPAPTHNKNQPYISGVIKNSKDLPLPNIMIYVKSTAGEVLRILKTNHHGVFASFHPLPEGEYVFETKDLGGTFFFDTMNVTIQSEDNPPLTIFSKEHI